MYEIFKEFSIDSAHFLPNVPAGHKCGQMHGHTYQITVFAAGTIGTDTGWVAPCHACMCARTCTAGCTYPAPAEVA